ncbi:MAG: MBL fold metallo-hydrolase RNA specificity domain-containing protein [Dermatophilaceae bacterium]
MATTLTFLGAAGTVTGSKFLLTVGDRRILVDAGMFQGEKDLRRINWADFPVPPDTITDVLLTHAHLDHVGYLPVLVKGGFAGPVWCTAYTENLATIVLRDAGFLQERDAEDARLGGWSKHEKPLPLYDSRDVEKTLPLLTPVDYDRDLDLGDGVSARWTRAGHILGAASIRVQTPDGSVLISGDLGRVDHPVLRARETPEGADIVLVESTYGDREHPEPKNLPHEPLADAIRRTINRGGSVLIPAFAVDRTEIVLKALSDMRRDGRIPRTPVYVNSPMAAAALEVYTRATDEMRVDLDLEDIRRDLREVRTADDSRELTMGTQQPSIIISSSGMATGGRVLHHLERMLPDPRNAVVLTGYQAPGTRGRALFEGAERLKMHGRYVGVKAEIVKDEEFSVHADASELVDWLRDLDPPPTTVFCVHGESRAAAALAARVTEELGLDAVVPVQGEVVLIEPGLRVEPPSSRAVAPEPAPAPAAPAAVALDGWSLSGAHVESDLTPHQDADGSIVLEGTIRIRLQP